MSRRVPSPVASWLLECVVTEPDREAVIGDLIEEYNLRMQSDTPWAVSRWWWGQVGRSIPPMLWTSVRRDWLRTLPVAIGAYVAAGVLEFAGTTAISRLFSLGALFDSLASVVVGLTTMLLAGYFAAWIRPAAAVVLAGIGLVVIVMLMVTMSDSAPFWYQLVFLVGAPAAPLVGRTLCLMKMKVDRPL
jgi:hypothetical protein